MEKFKSHKKRNDYERRDTRRGADTFSAELDECTVIGRNAVRELLESGRDIEKIFIQSGDREGSVNQLIGIAAEKKLRIIEADKQKLDQLAMGQRHQGIIAIAAERNYSSVDEIIAYAAEKGEKPLIVMLDGVEDPHNLGAIIRSAECSGVHGIIIPKRRAVGLTTTFATRICSIAPADALATVVVRPTALLFGIIIP